MPEAASYSHGSFCWYEIASRDVEAVKPFYSGLLGYELVDTPMPGGEGTYTMVKLNGGDLGGLWQMSGPEFEGVPPHWMPYVWVDDVHETAAKAQGLGATLLMPVMDVPGVGEMATLRDPTGAVFSIYHPKGHAGAANHGFDAGGVGWNELMTTDPDAARAFYTALFGWEAEAQDMGEFVYTTFSINGQGVAGMMGMAGPDYEGVPPHWMVYVTVDDADTTASKSKTLGGELVVGPQDIPHIGRFAVLRDPSGATFSVMQWSAEMQG